MKHLFVALVLLASACSSSGPGFEQRRLVLAQLVDEVVLPGLDAFVDKADALKTAVSALCASVSQTTLYAAQQAWLDARLAYKHTQAYGFGPADDDGISVDVDFWPARPDTVEKAIAETTSLDDAAIDKLGVSSKGLPALEVLLFGDIGGDDAAVLVAQADSKRCGYTEALGKALARAAGKLRSAWRDSFADELRQAGSATSTRYSVGRRAYDDWINHLIASVELIVSKKIGVPLGKSAGFVQAELVESPRAESSIADARGTLEGISKSYGAGAKGPDTLQALVAQLRPAVASDVRTQIDGLDALLAGVTMPLGVLMVDAPAKVEPIYEAARTLRQTFVTEVAPALDVKVTLSNNDGD
ncbi:MAG: imelysin family protein [Myxococcales bacterium]|nr:imelysin family protein [Myxococcales bacterium]